MHLGTSQRQEHRNSTRWANETLGANGDQLMPHAYIGLSETPAGSNIHKIKIHPQSREPAIVQPDGTVREIPLGNQAPAFSPSTLSDEFTGTALNSRWTVANNPAGGDAISLTQEPGSIWIGLPEGTHGNAQYATMPFIYQSPPLATKAWTAEIGGCLVVPDANTSNEAQISGVYICLAYDATPSGSELRGGIVNFYQSNTARNTLLPYGYRDGGSATWGNLLVRYIPRGSMIDILFSNDDTAAYTSAKSYSLYWRYHNTPLWNYLSTYTYTFSTAPDRLGILWNTPAIDATYTSHAISTVKYFRVIQ